MTYKHLLFSIFPCSIKHGAEYQYFARQHVKVGNSSTVKTLLCSSNVKSTSSKTVLQFRRIRNKLMPDLVSRQVQNFNESSLVTVLLRLGRNTRFAWMHSNHFFIQLGQILLSKCYNIFMSQICASTTFVFCNGIEGQVCECT